MSLAGFALGLILTPVEPKIGATCYGSWASASLGTGNIPVDGNNVPTSIVNIHAFLENGKVVAWKFDRYDGRSFIMSSVGFGAPVPYDDAFASTLERAGAREVSCFTHPLPKRVFR